jgi:hypothetical protein
LEKDFNIKDAVMNKFSSLFAAVIILGAASIASAATVSKHHYVGAGTAAAESFQNNWNVGY